MKTCPKCELTKNRDQFYVSKRRDGLRTYCKECDHACRVKTAPYTRAYNQRYYTENKGHLATQMSEYYREHKAEINEYTRGYYRERREHERERDILVRAKSRAKKFGIPFDLSVEDIVIPKVCPVLGLPIVVAAHGKKGPLPNSPSIDRIDGDKGYTRGNVRIISNRANTLKSDASVEELERVLADLKVLRGGTKAVDHNLGVCTSHGLRRYSEGLLPSWGSSVPTPLVDVQRPWACGSRYDKG